MPRCLSEMSVLAFPLHFNRKGTKTGHGILDTALQMPGNRILGWKRSLLS